MSYDAHPASSVTTGAASHATWSETEDTTMVEEREEGEEVGAVSTTEIDSGSTTENDILDDPEI